MEKSCRCEICTNDVHRASFPKHLKCKKHIENGKQNGIIIPEWSFNEEQAPIKKKMKKYTTSNP